MDEGHTHDTPPATVGSPLTPGCALAREWITVARHEFPLEAASQPPPP